MRPIFCLFVLLMGFGGEVGYLWQLARGQVALLWKAKPLDKVLKDQNLDLEHRKKLELVLAIKAFAQAEIGLETSQNYTTFVDLGAKPVSWNLVVCPKDRLEPLTWSYPVVGTVPYRGYFDQKEAQKAEASYQEKGFDTYLRPVSAYSTLGWFSDPVLSTMLRYSEAGLADLIIHELTHATVWIEGDVTFNESLASFVGETGALLWLAHRYGADATETDRVLAQREDTVVFRKFMQATSARLDSLYQLNLPFAETMAQRETVFKSSLERFKQLPFKSTAYEHVLSWQVNNARLALYRVYRERTPIFGQVYEACDRDLKKTVEILGQCAEQPDPVAWLNTWLETQ